MKALVLRGPGDFAYEERPDPERKPGTALLKIEAVSICGSDLHAVAGRMPLFSFPRVIGHEIAGTVVEIDANDRDIVPGDKVCVMPCIFCGTCIACRKGKTNCCASLKLYGVQVDGGLQERLVLPVDALAKAPPGASFEEISLVEPLTIGAHAISRVGIYPDDRFLVLGAGPIGVSVALLARAMGARPALADISPARAGFVFREFGFDVFDPLAPDYRDRLSAFTGGDMFHVVADTTANKESMDSCHTLIGNGGSILFVGMHKGRLEVDEAAFHMREPTLAVTRNSTPADFALVLDLWRGGKLEPRRLLTDVVPFERAAPEIVAWATGREHAFKGVVRF